MGEAMTFRCPDGSDCAGYLAEAAEATTGIVVLQEWWGLNDQIRGVAERFAGAGITALAPDLYGGRVTAEPDEAEHLMTGLDWPGACQVEVRGALQHLKAKLPKVAVTGFCMGGALAIIAAAKLSECDAAVCFYGIPPEDQAHPADVQVPFQGHFANDDHWCTPEAVDRLEAALGATAIPWEIHRYDAAHAFFNETVDAYDADATEASWARTLDFLAKHL
ncbi:MAG: dienelactone hydrolase family protein [Kiloniellales bacterium]|nr:dienelactone hydrolase family protein [Kiloniellales bacterium]